MKTTIKIISLLCALMMVFTLAACGGDDKAADDKAAGDNPASSAEGGDTSEPAAGANLTDFEWAKFEMPAGYSDAKESDNYITIAEDADDHHKMKISARTLFSGKTAADFAAEEVDDRNTLGEKFTVNGRDWYPVYFKFNDNDSVKLYADINEKKYTEITVYEMTENDAAVQTLLNTIEFNITEE